MLQRAASNAYSWWWASHIRTKQSKWLEQNLQDLEEKVAYTLKLIEEDGDSFAKRAEMYYKKRPELISFVEEAYRAYRALAERYDHISTELQNANNTIARICPDQVPYMDDDDDDPGPKGQKKPAAQTKNIPKVPDMPKKDLKGMITMANKKLRPSKSPKKAATVKVAKSGLSKAEGLKEIDNLQKQILALQTGKEFVNSSYESWLAKYWEIEEQIKELQQRVCYLQDEFGHGTLIEDDEARSLMAAAALKSCQETLTHMQEKQEKSAEEAKVERKRIEDARDKFESFKVELRGSEGNRKNPSVKDDYVKAVEESKSSDKDMVKITQHGEDLKIVEEKVKEQFDVGSSGFLTVTEMAEKIDEVVSKVVSLETSFSSQTTLVQRLRTETDELQAQIRALENDKANLINDKKHLSSKLIDMEEKLHRVQDLNRSVEDQNHSLQAHLTEAHYNLDQLSQKLQIQKSDEGRESSSENENQSPVQVKSLKEIEGQDLALNPKGDLKELPSVKLSEGHEEKHFKEDENKSPVKVQFDKGTEGTEVAKAKAKAEDEKKSLAKVLFEQGIGGAEGSKVNTLGEDEKKSLAKVQFEKRSEGTEGSTNIANENLLAKKPDEEFQSPNAVQNEEKDVVKVKSVEELKRHEKLNDHGVPEKARDVQTETVNDAKEKELCDTHGNHGGVVDQYQTNGKPREIISEIHEKVKEDKVEEQAASANTHDFLNVQTQEQATEQECEPDWKQMFLKGMENREKTILNEYTSVLRNYKEAKKKLDASGMKSMDKNDETLRQLQQLKSTNIEKDVEIQSLRKKLSILQAAFGDYDHERDQSETNNIQTENREADVSVTPREQSQPTSEIEEKFRMDIDELLEENLDFWLRFSTSFHEIQKFETEVKDLQNDASNLVTRLEEKQAKQEGSSSTRYDLKSDVRPLYKHLCELQSELTSCIEKSLLLKEELTSRCSSLNNIQEEITKALKMSAEDDDFRFTSYQAAKFQGEVLNMKQENNKVADELQAGLDHVKNLQAEVEKTQTMLGEKFKLSDSTNQKLEHSDSKNSIPLRSFIFGVKPKKSRAAFIFSMHPTLARKYNDFKAGVK